jgi:hypothetical protein
MATTGGINKALVINADNDSSGDGTLTIVSTKTVVTNNGDTTITAWDIDLPATLNAGTGAMTVHQSKSDGTIGLGSTAKDLYLTDAELDRITATGGLTIGSSTSGSLNVDGLTEGTDNVGAVTLIATRATRTVNFNVNPSFFNQALTVQAMGGVTVRQSVITINGATVVNAGTGTLTVGTARTLSTTNQHLTITADNIDMTGSAAISSGTAALKMECTTGGLAVGLGSIGQSVLPFWLSGNELQRITANGMTLGGSNCGDQLVNAITSAHSGFISGIFTLIGSRDDAKVVFAFYPSTFNAVSVQADNGVLLKRDLTTTIGAIFFDGDVENSSSSDTYKYRRFHRWSDCHCQNLLDT